MSDEASDHADICAKVLNERPESGATLGLGYPVAAICAKTMSMAISVIEWVVSQVQAAGGAAISGAAITYLKRNFRYSDLETQLNKEVAEWARLLPSNAAVVPESLFGLDQAKTGYKAGQALQVLARRLGSKRIPEVGEWSAAIEERRVDVGLALRAEAMPFFQLGFDDAKAHVDDLAMRLHGTCADEAAHFQRTMLDKVEGIEERLVRLETSITLAAAGAGGNAPIVADSVGVLGPLPSEPPDDHGLAVQVEAAKTLLENGQVDAAAILLEGADRDACLKPTSIYLRFRIKMNLGASNSRRWLLSEAIENYQSAIALKPDDDRGHRCLAGTLLMSGYFSQALEALRQIKGRIPTTSTLLGLEIQALSLLGRSDEARVIRDSHVSMREERDVLLASIEGGLETVEESTEILRILRARSADDSEVAWSLARNLGLRAQSSVEASRPLRWERSHPCFVWLEECESLLGEVLAGARARSDPHMRFILCIERAGVRASLSRYVEALDDLKSAGSLPGSTTAVDRLLGIVLVAQAEFQKALPHLETAWKAENEEAVGEALMTAYRRTGRLADMVKLVEAIPPELRTLRQEELMVRSLEEIGDASADAAWSRLLEKHSSDPHLTVVVAERLARTGEVSKAIDALKMELKRTEERKPATLVLRLADLLFAEKRFNEAALEYGRILNEQAPVELIHRRVYACYRSGATDEALGIAEASIKAGACSSPLLKIYARLLSDAGELAQARSVLEKLNQLEPSDLSHKIQLAWVELRAGSKEQATELIQKVSRAEIENDAGKLNDCLRIRHLLGLPGVLDLALRCLRVGFDDPRNHVAYIQIFLEYERAGSIPAEPSRVEVGTSVTVRPAGGGQARRLVLLEDGPFSALRSEYDAKGEVARELLGRRIGDEVSFRDGMFGPPKFKIEQIVSATVASFQDAIENFANRFPDSQALQPFTADEGTLKALAERLRGSAVEMEKILGLYEERCVPLHIVCESMGRDLLELYDYLASGQSHRLVVARGDLQHERSAAENARTVAFDLTALLAVQRIGLLDVALASFDAVFISQATIDELNTIVASRENDRGRRFIAGADGKFGFVETPDSLRQAELNTLRQLQLAIKTTFRAVGTRGLSAALAGKPGFDLSMVPPQAQGPLAAARNSGSSLCTDEYGLRALGRALFDLQVFSVQQLVHRIAASGKISTDTEYEILLGRVKSGAFWLHMDTEFFKWLVRREKGAASADLVHALSRLASGQCDDQPALVLGAQVISCALAGPANLQQVIRLCDAVLGAICTGRRMLVVLPRFYWVARHVLAAEGQATGDVCRRIKAWLQLAVAVG